MRRLFNQFIAIALGLSVIAMSVITAYSDEIVDIDHNVAEELTSPEIFQEEEEEPLKISFNDVKEKDWYYNQVCYVVGKGLMQGVGNQLFGPDRLATRAMIIKVLYAMEDNPKVERVSFSDVPQNAWYADAVSWGSKEGIVSGYSKSLFGPDDPVTREQLVTILYRYIAYKGGKTTSRSNLNLYEDKDEISSYASMPLKWAVSVGLIRGRSETMLVPNGKVTRAELATMLRTLREDIILYKKHNPGSLYDPMDPNSVNVPILLFHSFVEYSPESASITVSEFEKILTMLDDAGFNYISYNQLIDFVKTGAPLPKNPIILSIDDGYRNNLTYAYDVLKRHNACAEISVICSFIGFSGKYDTFSVIPHFSLEEVKELDEGIINIQSHTVRMHMPINYKDPSKGRKNVLRLENETYEGYKKALLDDFKESKEIISSVLDEPVALTYPHGDFSLEAEKAAKEAGFKITVGTKPGTNIITQGQPEGLYLLNRIELKSSISKEEFLKLISK